SADTWSAFCWRHACTPARPCAFGQSRATSAAHGRWGAGVDGSCWASAVPAPSRATRTRAAGEETGGRIEVAPGEAVGGSETRAPRRDKASSPPPRVGCGRGQLLDQPSSTQAADAQHEEIRALTREAELGPDLGHVGLLEAHIAD